MVNHNTSSVLKSLEKAYAENNISAWRKILFDHKNLFDPISFSYDLGLSYIHEGNLPYARFHFEEAWSLLKLEKLGAEHKKLPEFVAKKTELKQKIQKSRLYAQEIYQTKETSLLESFPNVSIFTVLNSFTCGLSLFFLIMLFVNLCKTRPPKIHKEVPLFFQRMRKHFVMILLILIPFIMQKVLTYRVHEAIVLRKAPILENPSYYEKKWALSNAGSKVLIRDFQDRWVFIEFPWQYRGWMEKRFIGVLPK